MNGTPRGRRALSDEEARLWSRIAASTTPLARRRAILEASVEEPAPKSPPRPAAKRPAKLAPAAAPRPSSPPAPGPRMDRKAYEALRRGRLEPEARIDLHGLTSERAHAALQSFILSSHAEGRRLVLVITGKGRSNEGPGALRRGAPHWLALPPLAARVLEIAPAHRRHGGDGALYVYLRRLR